MIRRAVIVGLLVVLALPLMYAMAELPTHGSLDSPAYTHIAPRYLQKGPEEAGAENIVTDIILNYRGFDTNFEVTVIFTAMAAVLGVLMGTGAGSKSAASSSNTTPPSVVVGFIVRVMAPLIITFAIYVILNGHITPGGGFQGGTIIGALFIALVLVLDEQDVARLLPRRGERLLQAAAPITFFLVGLTGLVAFGSYLSYPGGTGPLAWVTTMFLVIIEIGIGVGGAMVIVTIFRTMGGER